MTIGYLYPRFHQSLLNGEVSVAHAWKGTLHTSSYTPDLDAHRYQSSLTNELSTGSGYNSGGLTLANKALAYDAATNTAWVDCDDLVWDPSTLSARYLVIADTNSGSAATNPLIGLIDFEVTKSSDNGPFKAAINTTGLVRLTAT
ncbi:hypothetical protein BJY24_004132 [Nocardia transvalensis]|uniref:Uncharacterized protein n=1 Tax=Nocardia transvalensis TaxID=37333 RepID=A0A7W9PG35_9NOCA|nr:hypothetical protein [Nocardia transvalensis]MBB5915265.1 hypothetical protein [Nocardia transvalensis]